jgi:AbrB family looped-hinge helix DNA binding protein
MNAIVTIDSAGRIMLPKSLRERHGLRTGSKLQVRDDGRTIHLHAIAESSPLREVNGFLVYVGRSSRLSSTAEGAREERMQRLAGR